MTDTSTKVREHYSAANLTDRVRQALAPIVPEDQTLTVAQLAPLDQFHTRGMAATADLAAAYQKAQTEKRAGIVLLAEGAG